MLISFSVPLIPRGQGRPRFARIGAGVRTYSPRDTVRYQQEFIVLAAAFAPTRPLEGPLSVRLLFGLPIPRSRAAWWREAAMSGAVHPCGRPDIDNLAKAVLDALNDSGRWWRDDAQVTTLTVTKCYSETPGTEVTIDVIGSIASAKQWRHAT